jgi:hypothetical protein
MVVRRWRERAADRRHFRVRLRKPDPRSGVSGIRREREEQRRTVGSVYGFSWFFMISSDDIIIRRISSEKREGDRKRKELFLVGNQMALGIGRD